MSGATWTDEKIEALRRLWNLGWSASQIASELGGVTRNAVIAKTHRLRIAGGERAPEKRRDKQQRKPKPTSAGATAVKVSTPKVVQPYVERQARVFDPAKLVTFFELEDKHCKWPIGDPRHLGTTFRFCGESKVSGLPYCSECAAVAYAPPRINAEAPNLSAGGPGANSGYLWPSRAKATAGGASEREREDA